MNSLEDFLSTLRTLPSAQTLFLIPKFFPEAEVFVVGGALRDWLLGRFNPRLTDIDFVVRHVEADVLCAKLAKYGSVQLVEGEFGVLKFTPKNHHNQIDIALPRTEQRSNESLGGVRDFAISSDIHLPIEQDLARRDFTVNAMALNIHTGVFVDPFGGRHDLSSRVLSAVGFAQDRFSEDLTRILRGIRFCTQLNFTLEPQTEAAMRAGAPQLNTMRKDEHGARFVVSRETMGKELARAFFANPSLALTLCESLGILEEIFPAVYQHTLLHPNYLDPIRRAHPESYEHTILLLLRGLSADDIRTTLHMTGLDSLPRTSSLKLNVDHCVWMIDKIQSEPSAEDIRTMRASQFEKHFLGERGHQHQTLLTKLGHAETVSAIEARRADICAKWKCEGSEPIPTLVSGDDLLRLGVPAGPSIREWLETLRDLQLEGDLLTREAALKYLKTHPLS